MGSVVTFISTSAGVSEVGVRLAITLLAAQILALVYRRFLVDRFAKSLFHHLYFIATGLSIAYYCYGNGFVHPGLATTGTFLLIRLSSAIGRPIVARASVFLFTMTYLLIGYVFYSTDDYDINWTTPHCVLTLKLIAIAFDWADGQHVDDHVVQDPGTRPFREPPTLLEMYGYCYYFGAFHAGPVFAFKQYRMFTSGKVSGKSGIPDSWHRGLVQFVTGIVILAVDSVLSAFINKTTFQSDMFHKLSLPLAHLYVGAWALVWAYRYVAIWLLTDSSNIFSGMAYKPGKGEGKPTWHSMANVEPYVLLFSPRLINIIDSFNILTNHFVLNHVYKRLRFLNSKMISQLAVLTFLSVWHGFHIGYWAAFVICEMPFMKAEQALVDIFYPHVGSYPFLMKVVACVAPVLKWISWGYGLVAFDFLHMNLILPVWKKLYFTPHFIAVGLIVASLVISMQRQSAAKAKKRRETNGLTKQE